MRFPQGWELIVVLAVILLLFGSKKLPDAARGLGRSLRIFKSEIKTMQDEDDSTTITTTTTTKATPAPPAIPPATAESPHAGEPGSTDPQRETPPRVEG